MVAALKAPPPFLRHADGCNDEEFIRCLFDAGTQRREKIKVLPKDLFSFYWRRRSPVNRGEGSRCEGLSVVSLLIASRFRTEHKTKKKK